MNPRLAGSLFRCPLAGLALGGIVAVAALLCVPAFAADTSPEPAARTGAAPAAEHDADRFFRSIVKIETRAVPDARSLASLGATREGTGIVIGDDGLILTIGYLLVEADEVKIVDGRGRTLPARLVGYDHATGLGLVRAVVPLGAPALAFGDSGTLTERDAVLVVNYAGADEVTLTRVVAKRPFTANWEYQLDQAIFTSPPALNWSGAALVDKDLKVVGVGSLIMREVPGAEVPGNMFVPIDALKPILADMVKSGRRAGPARPWLGVAADEVQGRLVVTRVSPDGPGDAAGLRPGDIILGVAGDGVRTQDEFYRKVWGRGAAGAEIPLRVLQGVDVKDLQLRSIDRVQYFRPVTTY
jgi:serine protease Do